MILLCRQCRSYTHGLVSRGSRRRPRISSQGNETTRLRTGAATAGPRGIQQRRPGARTPTGSSSTSSRTTSTDRPTRSTRGILRSRGCSRPSTSGSSQKARLAVWICSCAIPTSTSRRGSESRRRSRRCAMRWTARASRHRRGCRGRIQMPPNRSPFPDDTDGRRETGPRRSAPRT